MIQEQIEIGDKILTMMLQRGGSSNLDQYPFFLKSDGYDYHKHVLPTVNSLKSYGLVESVSDYEIRLTQEGFEAARTGLLNYFQKKDYASNLEIREKESTIFSAKTATVISIISIAVAILSMLLGANLLPVKPLENSENKSSDRHNQSHNREEKSKVGVSESLVMPEHISELKKAVLHDSTFIKELAKEIKRLQ